MTKFARLGWIAVVLIAVIGLWQLKAKIDDRALGIYTPEQKERVVAYQKQIMKSVEEIHDRYEKAIPEGATRIPNSEGVAVERANKITYTIDKFTTVDGKCKVAFRLNRQLNSWQDVVGAQINGKTVSADRIGNSPDVMADCPKKNEELALTVKGPKDRRFIYIVVGE